MRTSRRQARGCPTVQRKRATFYNGLGYAVELELIASNPVDRVQWTPPEVAQSIDRRVVGNPAQVATLLEAVKSFGKRADKDHRVLWLSLQHGDAPLGSRRPTA
ncbi:hypothetical protein GCM10027614_50910 [Micromonospora vulcania]